MVTYTVYSFTFTHNFPSVNVKGFNVGVTVDKKYGSGNVVELKCSIKKQVVFY